MGDGRLTVPRWTWAAASTRGTSHERAGTKRQDAYRCFTAGSDNRFLVAIVSDGAGSASRSELGSWLACRVIAARAATHLLSTGKLPDNDVIWHWLDDTRDCHSIAAERKSISRRELAATLVTLISDGEQTVAVHVGDGAAAVRYGKSGGWHALSWPEQGEYASTTFFLTDDPAPRLRVTFLEQPIDAVAVFTDGIERLALDFSGKIAHDPFFKGMIASIDASSAGALDVELSRSLASFLDSEAVNQKTDDDKTLVLAALR